MNHGSFGRVRTSAAPERAPGQAAKYRILTDLGQAGMADVFLGVATGNEGAADLVVLKMLRSDLATSQEFASLFAQEARLALHVHHPNLVRARELELVDDRLAIVLDYTDGVSLSQVAKTLSCDPALRLRVGLHTLLDTLAGLHCIHELCDDDGAPLDLVHRDLSPNDVFLTYDGQVKLLDFGLTRPAPAASRTPRAVRRGKVHYMAPEQMLDEELDRRADVFAAGALLWELLAGERLWKSDNPVVVMHCLFSGAIPSPAALNPALPDELVAICMKALAPERDDRYATALELRNDLEEYVASAGLTMTASELGELLSGLFAQQRENLQAIIAQQLLEVAAGPAVARGRRAARRFGNARLGVASAFLGALFLSVLALAATRARDAGPTAFAATAPQAPSAVAPVVWEVPDSIDPAPSVQAVPRRPVTKKAGDGRRGP
jgi:serine/threonine protein kinase